MARLQAKDRTAILNLRIPPSPAAFFRPRREVVMTGFALFLTLA